MFLDEWIDMLYVTANIDRVADRRGAVPHAESENCIEDETWDGSRGETNVPNPSQALCRLKYMYDSLERTIVASQDRWKTCMLTVRYLVHIGATRN